MSLTTDEYSYNMINKFLFADSQHEIHPVIYTTIKELKQHSVQPYIIKRFLDITAEHLTEYKPNEYDSQQLANIKLSIIFLNQFKSVIAEI